MQALASGEFPAQAVEGEGVKAQAGSRQEDQIAPRFLHGHPQAAPDPARARRLAEGEQVPVLRRRLKDEDVADQTGDGGGDQVGEEPCKLAARLSGACDDTQHFAISRDLRNRSRPQGPGDAEARDFLLGSTPDSTAGSGR